MDSGCLECQHGAIWCEKQLTRVSQEGHDRLNNRMLVYSVQVIYLCLILSSFRENQNGLVLQSIPAMELHVASSSPTRESDESTLVNSENGSSDSLESPQPARRPNRPGSRMPQTRADMITTWRQRHSRSVSPIQIYNRSRTEQHSQGRQMPYLRNRAETQSYLPRASQIPLGNWSQVLQPEISDEEIVPDSEEDRRHMGTRHGSESV